MPIQHFDTYVIAALCFHVLFMAAHLFFASDRRTDYLRLLGCSFLMLGMWYCSMFMEQTGLFATYPWLIEWPTLFVPLFAPCLYFYVVALSSEKRWHLKGQNRWHFYIALFIVALEVPYTLAPSDIKILQLTRTTEGNTETASLILQMAWVSTILMLVQFGMYLALSLRRLIHHAERIRHLFSNLENRTLAWLRNYLILLIILWILGVSDFFDLPGSYRWLLHLVWVLTLSFMSLRQKPVFETVSKQHTILPAITPTTDTSSKATPVSPAAETAELIKPDPPVSTRTGKTTLSDERRSRVAAKLRKAMEENRLYKDADLTLRKLSDVTNVSTHHISETLRDEIGQNFYDYINSCRVAEACMLLESTEDAVVDIAYAVGFNSRSTFGAALKKHRGLSPAAYRKQVA